MSLTDLRKELKELRKSVMAGPVSKLRKTDCVREIERLKGIHHGEVKKVEEVMKKEEVAKPVAKKVKAIQEVAHAKVEKVVEKKETKKAEPKKEKKEEKKEEPMRPTKYIKGSEEAKEHMRKIREMRKKD